MQVRDELEKRGYDVTPYFSNGEENTLIPCPFHMEENPSLAVSLSRGQFRCFGCEETGSFAKLIAQIDGISVKEARKLIGEQRTIESAMDEIEKNLAAVVQQEALKYYNVESFHKVFPRVRGTEGEKYLWSRRIKSSTMLRFDIRFAATGKWNNRVILPIYLETGQLLSWCGRSIDGSQPKTRKNRSSRAALYGLFELIQNQPNWMMGKYKAPVLFIVEGEFDAIYLQQFGYHAVAAMGTAGLTPHQRALVVKYAERVALCYDNDKAGVRATYGDEAKGKVGDYSKLRDLLPTTVVKLPKGKDPNDLSIKRVQQIFNQYN